jgi:hypothetical protein
MGEPWKWSWHSSQLERNGAPLLECGAVVCRQVLDKADVVRDGRLWVTAEAHRRVVDEYRFYGRCLSKIGGLQALINIHIRVVCTRRVVERVLDELEAGNPHRIKGKVIGPAGVPRRDRSCTEVLHRFHPLTEDWFRGSILLQIHTANTPAAIVYVEVAGHLLLFGFELQRPTRLAEEFRLGELVRRGGARERAEMLRDVPL